MPEKENEADLAILEHDGDDMGSWKSNPQTARVRKTVTGRYVALLKELAKMSLTSSDPRIAAKGAQIQEATAYILLMGGKV